MNTTDYLREGYKRLSDTKYYTKLPDNPTDKIANNVTETLIQMRQKGLITEKNFEHLTLDNCMEARFCMLPKIHKKVSQADPSAVQSTTQLVESVN